VTSPYRPVCTAKAGIWSGETLCHDIYPARPITIVSLVTNTYCMMDGHNSCAPWTPGSNLAVCVNRAIDDRPGIQQEAICYQWFKQRLILSVSNPSISQQSQIKEDTVEPSVCAREFNLKAYAAITDPMIRPGWASNPDSPITLARQRVLRRYQQRHRGRLT